MKLIFLISHGVSMLYHSVSLQFRNWVVWDTNNTIIVRVCIFDLWRITNLYIVWKGTRYCEVLFLARKGRIILRITTKTMEVTIKVINFYILLFNKTTSNKNITTINQGRGECKESLSRNYELDFPTNKHPNKLYK